MGKNKEVKVAIETLHDEMKIALVSTKFMELEFINTMMIDLVFKDNLNYKDAYETLRDAIYKRMEKYKEIILLTQKEEMKVQ